MSASSSNQRELLLDNMPPELRDGPTPGAHQPHPHSIRALLLDSVVPRLHSTLDVAASAMSIDFLAPPSTFTSTGSKRSATMISNDTDSTIAKCPLQRLNLDYNGPFPGLYAMHLAPNLQIRSVEPFPDLPIRLVESIWKYPSLDVRIPPAHTYSRSSMDDEFGEYTAHRGKSVESIGDLKDAHRYRESMVATFASVLVGFLPSVEKSGFMKWTQSPQNLYPGSAEALAGGYVSVDLSLPHVSPSVKGMLQAGIDAIKKFRLSDIQVTHFQAICAPLDSEFPLWALVLFAEQGLNLTSLTCQGKSDPNYFCGSDRCTTDMAGLFPRSGRPTGVDGEPALDLIRHCHPDKASTSDEMSLTEELQLIVSILLHLLWAKAVAADATFIILTGGNCEIICVRVRDTQKLYISNILPVDRQPFPSTTHLALHTAIDIAAFNDAVSRGLKNEMHMEAGTLPATFRQNCVGEINPYSSTLGFAELSSFFEVSVGKFLPADVSSNAESFDDVHCRFLGAAGVQIHWVDGDLIDILPNLKSPLRLESLSPGAVILHVKIHCLKEGGWRVFLCHFVDDDEVQAPYGRPFLVKIAWDEWEENLLIENNHLDGFEDCSDYILSRVPRTYGVFTGQKDGYHFTVCFMEHCDGYPLGIADDIDNELQTSIQEWVDRLHKEARIVHTNLGIGDNILFNPSDPKSFYVVGWNDARKVYDPSEEERENITVSSLLRRVTLKKSPVIIPPQKKLREIGTQT